MATTTWRQWGDILLLTTGLRAHRLQRAPALWLVAAPARNCVLSSLFGMVTDEQCDMPLLTRPTPHPGHGQTRPLLRLKKGQDFGVLHSACLRNESLVSAQQSPCARPAIPAWPSCCYRRHSLLLVLPCPPVSASRSQQVDVHYGV